MNKSYKIKKRLFGLPEFVKAKTILFYVSTKDEVETKNMIKDTLSLGKRVVVPISDVENKKLILSELKSLDELESGAFNILEPKKEYFRPVLPEDIDLVIVPGPKGKEDIVKRGLVDHEKIVITGYPKIDSFLHSNFDSNVFKKKLGLDFSKKTVLYAPTWFRWNFSSFSRYVL